MGILSIRDIDLRGKKVLLRVDFNVPLDESGHITDDSRIKAAIPTIQFILDHGGAVILMSHLGRPKGKKSLAFSLKPCAERLAEILHKDVIMAPDCIGKNVEDMAKGLSPGQVLLLENLRFYDAEEHPEKDPAFAKQLAQLGDVYVNDAFGTAHRAHASTATIAQYFPGKAAVGMLMEKEVKALEATLVNPKSPFYAIIGGAKISTKIGVLQSLIDKVDGLFIGGGMVYTFMKAKGIPIGDSIHEDQFLQTALQIVSRCEQKKVPCYLPKDIVVVNKEGEVKVIDYTQGIPEGYQGMDIGPKTIQQFNDALRVAKTIFWNGPVGVFEDSRFCKGTESLARTLAQSHATTVIGGGDSVAAINKLGLQDKMTHLSTGGGATLEYIEFGSLPGIEALAGRGFA